MSHKTTLDTAIILSCITGIILSYAYLDVPVQRRLSVGILATVGIQFLLLAVIDAAGAGQPKYHAGRTSIVFGKEEKENQIDINLKNTDYAGTIDGEHAVMNYSNGSCT